MKEEYNEPKVIIFKIEPEKLVCLSGEREDYDPEEWQSKWGKYYEKLY